MKEDQNRIKNKVNTKEKKIDKVVCKNKEETKEIKETEETKEIKEEIKEEIIKDTEKVLNITI